MHDSIVIPTCFTANEKQQNNEPNLTQTITKSGRSVFMSIYRTKLANQCRLITITWCKHLLLHGLSISVESATNEDQQKQQLYHCKIELKPWYFWRKQGSKQFLVDQNIVDVVWDLKAAKFNGETEPQSDFYVGIICDGEFILLLGDLKKDAYRKTKCRPALNEPILISRKEHIFGKKKFHTRIKFQEKEKFNDICIEYSLECEPQLEIKVNGEIGIEIKHLQWKFRGNEMINVGKNNVEVYWDVHDWLFGTGFKHGLFIFKPVVSSSKITTSFCSSMPLLNNDYEEIVYVPIEDDHNSENYDGGSSRCCLFLYTWKVE